MSNSAQRQSPFTYQDILKLPDGVTGEIIDGQLYTSPRPGFQHGIAHTGIGSEIHSRFQVGRGGPGGWWIILELELHLGTDILVPDLSGWRKEKLPQKPTGAYAEIAPDWVCEIISPSSVRMDRITKYEKYREHKIPHYWLVDPTNKTLDVFQLSADQWKLLSTFHGHDKVRAVPFEAVEIDLSVLWADS